MTRSRSRNERTPLRHAAAVWDDDRQSSVAVHLLEMREEVLNNFSRKGAVIGLSQLHSQLKTAPPAQAKSG